MAKELLIVDRIGDHIRIQRSPGLLTPIEADFIADRLRSYAADIRRDHARAICADEGHLWWVRRIGPDIDDQVATKWDCFRDYCDGDRLVEGWSNPGHCRQVGCGRRLSDYYELRIDGRDVRWCYECFDQHRFETRPQ